MRVFRGVSSGIVGLVVFTVIAVPCVAEESVVASVRTVKGTVVVLRGADELAVGPGDGLFASDVVRTGANGAIEIVYGGGAAVLVESDREATVEKLAPEGAGPGDGAVGSIKTAKGGVNVIRDGAQLPARVGMRLFERDTLQTAKDGSVGVILRDDTTLSLGPSSELAMKEFLFKPSEEEYSLVANMIKGTLVYVSGVIGRLSPESVKVETPVGIVAVRGTKFLVKVGR